MKIRYIVAAGLMALMSMSSCTDEFLGITQENTAPTEELNYADKSQMYGPVSGVYGTTRRRMSQWEIWPLLNVRGDEVTKGGGSDNDQFDYLNVERFNYGAIKGFWALNNSWNALYNIVYTTYNNEALLNRFREHLTDEADIELGNQYEAEIRFHRALAYFFISNLWGDVPLVDFENLMRLDLPKVKQAGVREFIHSELDYCIEHLPAGRPDQQSHQGAVTKYTAMALKAKVALYEEDYATVKNLTDKIISEGGFSLYSDYYNLFKIPGKLAPESLYELQFTDFGNGDGDQVYGGAWFQHQGPRGNAAPVNGWGFMILEGGFLDFLNERNDSTRWDVAVLESGATTPAGDEIAEFVPSYLDGLKAHYNGKAYTPKNQLTEGRNNYGANNNIRVLRYADVLLMNAEANLKVGGDAATPLNEVRVRAGLEPIGSPTLDDIINERRAEFSCEWGDRFMDLVRTGKAQSVLPGFIPGESEFLPIPLAQEDLNPLLREPAI
ncbi:RagB/SusD family nutrient uptake outer membrane protein [Limibacter armeniacum]|uniref:RagB/SusD family nutrient uptake outer membrane protein n=1 Tax=Limibacter armeniacum TaxID=466084 RepID=UPI002FE5E828